MLQISHIDHIVLTVENLDATCEFYARVLGMQIVTFGDNRKALKFGQQKINLHQLGHEFEPKAAHPTSGSLDLCLISDTPLEQVVVQLEQMGVPIESGIVQRTGAVGAIASLYIRDPDDNLIEISNYIR